MAILPPAESLPTPRADIRHTGQTLLDGIGLITLIGAIKNADEAADAVSDIAKNMDEIFMARRKLVN